MIGITGIILIITVEDGDIMEIKTPVDKEGYRIQDFQREDRMTMIEDQEKGLITKRALKEMDISKEDFKII